MEPNLDNAPCLYFTSTHEGIIVGVNETLCYHLVYAKTELVGQKLELIFTIATRIFYQTHLFPLLKLQGHAEEIFITLQSKTKTHIPVLISAVKKENENEITLICAGIVVHNRKKFEDELVSARKTAESALHENTDLIKAKASLQQHMEELDRNIAIVKRLNDDWRKINRV
jgi:sigma-B regulation protein RsbU (phosphoserine phosphatase)